MKKALIFVNSDIVIYNFKKELLLALIEKGFEVYVSVPFGGKIELLKEIGVKLIETKIDRRGINPFSDLKLYAQYDKIIKQIKPEFIMTLTVKCNIYGGKAARKHKIPYYCNVTGLGTAFQKNNWLKKIVVRLYKSALKGVNKVFFENESNLQVFLSEKIIPEDKACLLKGAGVNLDEFEFEPMPERDFVSFLYLGRIMKEKGIDELLFAAEKIHAEFPFFKIKLVGYCEENYSDKLDEAQKKGFAEYCGFQNCVKDFIKDADCVVLPSYHEGMSNTLLESASMGRPLITSDIPGCREALEDGQNGFLCKAKSGESLYDAMKRFMLLSGEERQRMGIASRRLMEKSFDRKSVVNTTLNVVLSEEEALK